jgi:hypothetical protein
MKEKSYEQVLDEMTEEDKVNNPSHYKGKFGLEAIDVVRNFMTTEEIRGFYKGNTLKYILREAKKNGLEDLKKARKNLDWLIEGMENE